MFSSSYKATYTCERPNVRHFPTYISTDIKRKAVGKSFWTKYKILIYNRFIFKTIIKNSFGLRCRRRGALSYEWSWWTLCHCLIHHCCLCWPWEGADNHQNFAVRIYEYRFKFLLTVFLPIAVSGLGKKFCNISKVYIFRGAHKISKRDY